MDSPASVTKIINNLWFSLFTNPISEVKTKLNDSVFLSNWPISQMSVNWWLRIRPWLIVLSRFPRTDSKSPFSPGSPEDEEQNYRMSFTFYCRYTLELSHQCCLGTRKKKKAQNHPFKCLSSCWTKRWAALLWSPSGNEISKLEGHQSMSNRELKDQDSLA